jgi:hypothetical protein
LIFTDFDAALEEANWCANDEKKIYSVLVTPDGFSVQASGKKRKKYRGLEVGFTGFRYFTNRTLKKKEQG